MCAGRFVVLLASILLAACSPALDWREVRAPDGSFSVLMPQKPGKSERALATPAGPVTMRMLAARVGDSVFGVGVADFATPPDAALKDGLRDALVRNLNGRLVSDKPVANGAAAGREIVVVGSSGAGAGAVTVHLRARLLCAGQRYYQVAAVGRDGALPETDAEMFLASFRPN